MNLTTHSFSHDSNHSIRPRFSDPLPRPLANTKSNEPANIGGQAPSTSDVCTFPLGEVKKLPTQTKQRTLTNGWICNISAGYKFSGCASNQIQLGYEKLVKPLLDAKSVDYSNIAEALITQQFNYLCQLLMAGNCKTLYFDAAFTQAQFETIRKLQIHSKTELVNARLVFMFANIQHA